jgi:hypothetical protein
MVLAFHDEERINSIETAGLADVATIEPSSKQRNTPLESKFQQALLCISEFRPSGPPNSKSPFQSRGTKVDKL